MKTAVIMQRELFGMPVSQHSKTEYFSATDLVKAGNKYRVINGLSPFNEKAWMATKGTKEFIEELELKFGKVKISARGRGQHTWIHPLLFIDMALAISPKLKIETYEWMFDHLIKNRNESGDSYNLLCGALYKRHTNKATFHKYIQDVAKNIRLACDVVDWNKASASQLKARDKIHKEAALLCEVLQDNDVALQIAFARVLGVEHVIPKLANN
jgi:hypothetical protein